MINVKLVLRILSFANILLSKISVSRAKKVQKNEELAKMLKLDSNKHQTEIDKALSAAEKLKELL